MVELGTNICSPLGTNGMRGHVWDNYTSETFKNLLAVGKADGTIVYQRGFGWQDSDHHTELRHDALMRIASCSKPMTASLSAASSVPGPARR